MRGCRAPITQMRVTLVVSVLLVFCNAIPDVLKNHNSNRRPLGPSKHPAPISHRRAGVLYSIFHAGAAHLMHRAQAAGNATLTVERVIRSDGYLKLDDVFPAGVPPGFAAEIYNTEPQLGFYCLYRPRPGENVTADTPVCRNISGVAEQHAAWLTGAGFDYVGIDITNWPQTGVLGPDQGASVDVTILRPLQVLAEEWLALRARGLPTPSIVAWPSLACGGEQVFCMGGNGSEAGTEAMWRWLLDNFYNHPKYQEIVYRNQRHKKVMFLPSAEAPAYNNQLMVDLIQSNGGRHDIDVRPVWAITEDYFDRGAWGFFATCRTPEGNQTASIVGAAECNQTASTDVPGGDVVEISASAGFMLAQSGLPFANPGHLRGLTVQRLFRKVLQYGAPDLFMSSFNEFIGGRQDVSFPWVNTAFNMGLPNDPNKAVWADTYASEFSRDFEPSVESGDRLYRVVSSCVQMYKAGHTCENQGAKEQLCCSTHDKEVFANVWSLRATRQADSYLTVDASEKHKMIASKNWTEVCNPFPGPSVFCVNNMSIHTPVDGRDGPFMIYNRPVSDVATRPLYRCVSDSHPPRHFFSVDDSCEGLGRMQTQLGEIAISRGREMLRALRRCLGTEGHRIHALDLLCDKPDVSQDVLGFVR